ncbi:MAG: Hint domain-containing protein [Cyanobacteria bacterium P01_F01_bin.143]
MAKLHINISPNTTLREDAGSSFEAIFYLEFEDGDPTEPDQSFDWNLSVPGLFDSIDPVGSGDASFPSGGSGTITGFAGYGDTEGNRITLQIATPLTDELVENDEGLFFNISNLSDGLNLGSGSSAQTTLIIEDECFLEGTNILTEYGYRKIEDLKIGDKVKTFDGKLEEIKWIGKQTRHRFTAHPFRSLPIQIKAGALGDNMPRCDLFVSPDHSILIEGLLINAGAIENGVSIVKTYPTQYTYYHIELENHALLDAEGIPAESFFPNKEDRSTYDNGAEYEKLYPHGSKLMFWPMDYFRISSKNKVPRFVTKKLMDIANKLNNEEALSVG